MAQTENRLRIIPLGGLDEVGKNMTVIEYGDDLVVVDAGIMFPDDDHPGVDLILPDYSYVVKRKDKLRGIIITHGHEDHTGALPYLLKELAAPVPVLGTKLTLGLVQGKLEEHKLKKVKLREVRDGGHVSLGAFGFDFFAVNHSIPDAVGVFIRTPVGNIVHTGDFKLDQTPIDGRLTDYGALAKFGKLGVVFPPLLALVLDLDNGGDMSLACAFQSISLCFIRDDRDDLRSKLAIRARVDNRLQVRAVTGNEHDEPCTVSRMCGGLIGIISHLGE